MNNSLDLFVIMVGTNNLKYVDPGKYKTKQLRKIGSRHGKPVIYQIDCRKMVKEGFRFYLSANKVWLTKAVPARYLKK